MNRRLISKLLALLLAVSLGVGSLVIPVFSASSGEDNELVPFVLLNRDFEDKTVVTNGFAAGQTAGNTIKLMEEDGNTFLYWCADSTETATKHGHYNIDASDYIADEGSIVVRFKVKTDNITSTKRSFVTARPYDHHHGASIMGDDGKPLGYYSGASSIAYLKLNSSVPGVSLLDSGAFYPADEFVEVAYVFVWTNKTNATCYAYYDGDPTPVDTFVLPSIYGVDTRPCYFRFDVNGGHGYSWCLDDLIVYTADTTDPQEAFSVKLPKNNPGALYNENAGKYYDESLLSGSAFFKLGVSRALGNDHSTVHSLADAPFEQDGVIYLPASALTKVMGAAPVGGTRTVNGVSAVALDDINAAYPEYYASYHSSGLIAVGKTDELLVEGMNERVLISIMQMFLFDHIDTDHNKVNAFTIEEGQYTDHPYILADQAKFDELRAVYLDEDGTADPVLRGYIRNTLSSYTGIYNTYAVEVGGEYSALNETKGLVAGQGNINNMPYLPDDGYDIGGRLEESGSHANNIMKLAYAYQITREDKYARLAYDYAVALGNWEHWGPGHFLNCADAAGPYALAYDWLYDAWQSLGLDVTVIEDIIFTHAVVPGYYSARSSTLPEGWHRCISGIKTASGWGYNTAVNNWNAVCASGMIMASLAIVSIDRDSTGVYIDTDVNKVAGEKSQLITATGVHTDMYTYQDYALYMINQCFWGLEMYGLEQYMPDGSYIESNGYWSYGTNNLFELVAAVTTATEYNTGVANDFGILNAWGMDKTCYYAINTQSGDYQSWNYHDSGSTGAQDTSWFYFVSRATGDTDLGELRRIALNSGKSGNATLQDILFYEESTGVLKQPELQYYMYGINGYVVRDSWDSGSIYAGIMGDSNNVSHGQIDSGSFVYYNGGTTWICDLGSDNYNCYGFWGANTTRYRYYVMGAEGNNTLFLASRQQTVPYGQTLNGFGYIEETGDNAYGAYSIIDNTSVYGRYAESAYRAMLMTNDRRTVVIQDEVEFYEKETAYWVVHTAQQVYLSVDGTVAYLYDGKSVIRITLIDKAGTGARFALEDAYTFHLDGSAEMDELARKYYESGTHELNKDRSAYKKLTVAFENVKSIKLAAVIEEIAVGEICEVGYEWVDIADWNESTPCPNGKVNDTRVALFDADSGSIGTIESSLGNLNYYTATVDGSLAYVIGAGNSSAASEISFRARASLAEYGSLGDRVAVAELDLSTYSVLPSGTRLSLTGKGGEIIGFPLSSITTLEPTQWLRLTVAMDCGEGKYYVWLDDTLATYGYFAPKSCEDLGISVTSAGGSAVVGSLILDNISLRILPSDYTALDASFSGGSIAEWADRTPLVERVKTPVASVVYTLKDYDFEGDTPVADIIGGSSVTVTENADGSVKCEVEVYSWDDLEQHLVSGAVLTLYSSNPLNLVTVPNPITVHTNGYSFNAISYKYIARIDGDDIHYERGSVTVTWVTEEGRFTETYFSSVIPTAPTGVAGTTVYETQFEGGYRYYTYNGWSLTSGGALLDDSEMIITTERNTFYQSRRAYDGAFVTVKNGVITGHTDPQDLFDAAVIKGSYDRICLTSDVYYDGTGTGANASLSAPITIYLNGFTLTYDSEDTSDHAFIYYSTLNIIGPGTIINDSASSNLLMGQKGGRGLVDNVVFYSTRAITDHRGGFTEFRNCEINITKSGAAAFGLVNRNNVQVADKDKPYLYINGCTVNMPLASGNNAVFTVNLNSILELNDTVVNVGSGCYLLLLSNSTTGTVSDFDYVNGYREMQIRIGELSHNCTNLVRTSTSDSSGKTYEDMAEKVFYIEGVTFVEKPDGVRVAEGYTLVRQDVAGLPYAIVKNASVVTVTWRVGGASVSELWRKGCVPSPDSDLLKGLLDGAPEGMGYVFDASPLEGDVELVGSLITKLDVSVNLTLHSGFTINFYIKPKQGVTYTDFIVDGHSAEGSRVLIDGVEYIKLTAERDDPSIAARPVRLTVVLDDAASGASSVSVSTDVSIVSYAESILTDGTQSAEAKLLMANILKYIEAAYVYSANTTAPEYKGVIGTLNAYSELTTVSAVVRTDSDMSSVAHAFDGAALNLTANPGYRFYVEDGFTGTLTVTYTSAAVGEEGGYTVTRTVNCSDLADIDGVTADGTRFFDVYMNSFDLAAQLTLTAQAEDGIASATYVLSDYYHAIAKELDPLSGLLNALYAYAETARLYADSVNAAEV